MHPRFFIRVLNWVVISELGPICVPDSYLVWHSLKGRSWGKSKKINPILVPQKNRGIGGAALGAGDVVLAVAAARHRRADVQWDGLLHIGQRLQFGILRLSVLERKGSENNGNLSAAH